MKKLKLKVFFVIFSLLTIFSFIVISTSTARFYLERRNSISQKLIKISKSFEDFDNDGEKDKFDIEQLEKYQNSRRIYLDFTIYTVLLDDNGNYNGVINHTYNDVDEKNVEKLANDIIKNHKDRLYVGNLYTSRFAYVFTSDNTLVIMDNIEINKLLIEDLILNIILFILCEIVIFIITNIITKWIIAPVRNTFEKQKTFVADASHELKTPLAVMIASADAFLNDKDEKWVRNMKSESERMSKLVTELLDLAKLEQEQEIIMGDNNLSDIILSSILTFESLFYEKNIKLKYDIKSNINMKCNKDLIIELMSILIDNAIKHCKDKGKVNVHLYKKNRQIILEVKNTGLPIKKGDEEKIFERFYKGDVSRNRNSNNYGLGLAIAKNIVEKQNGEIKAQSSGGYTTFKVIWN